MMKPAVSLYSFAGYRRKTGASLAECVDKAAEAGVKGVDIVPDDCGGGKEALTAAADLGARIRAAGMTAVCCCVGSDFLNASGGVKKEADRVRRMVDLAAAYGCTLLRHDATRGYPAAVKTKRGLEDVLDKLAEGYAIVTEYAAGCGIKTCVENHGFFMQDSYRVERLINAVGHPNFGALVDIGNFSCADEDNGKATGVLAPYAFHAHAKDFHIRSGREDDPGEGWFRSRGGNFLRGAILGHGNIAVGQCIGVLARAGYDGWLCLEFEGLEDSLEGIRIGLANLGKLIDRYGR